MAILQSPGLSITVTDESQYVSAGPGTVPLILLATARNKVNPATGGVAAGTTDTNAGTLQVFSSQRELINAMGYPTFRTAAGAPLHGDERNEYGLQAAYSSLGLGSRAFVIRADIDLDQLTATSVRPKGQVSNGFTWLDLAQTKFGVFVWNAETQTYSAVTPEMITSSAEVNTDTVNTPKDNVGQVGSYAAVVLNQNNPLFYRTDSASSAWVALGTTDWQKVWPTVRSTRTTYVGNEVADATQITINGTTVTLTATDGVTCTGADVVNSINSAFAANYGDGIRAEIDANGRLIIRATSASESTGSTADGKVTIAAGAGATALGLTAGTYFAPMLQFGKYTEVPTFGTGEATPAPTGSIWIKTTSVGSGANWAVKRFSSSSLQFVTVSAPVYASREQALFELDALNGGVGIADGTVFVQHSTLTNYPATFKVMTRLGTGATRVTPTAAPSTTFTIGNSFTLTVTEAGSAAMSSYVITLSGTSTDNFITAILARNIPNVFAVKEANGAISLIHRSGGDIVMTNGTGTPVTTAGFTSSTTGVYAETSGALAGSLRATRWKPVGTDLTFSVETPYVAPEDGTLWYYGNAVEADVLVAGSDGWRGYRTVSNDARGYDLSLTDPNGPIFSATRPTLQSNGNSAVRGDLWVDTSDLENFPKLYRYNGTNWIAIDKTDRITQNGILFADARWDASLSGGSSVGGIIDPISGALPVISDMLLSNYIDLDCPDYRLYPRGTILWNTRRNGMNVKQFVSNKFTTLAYPDASDTGTNLTGTIPTNKSTWSNASGVQSDGTPYHGHKAQRQMVVKALKSAIDSNGVVREEQFEFNIICCPGYPELISNLVSLNKDRNETAFIIGDTPIDLSTSVTELTTWSNTQEVTGSNMVGVYYPSGLANDINGNEVAVPPSHMALRTFLLNDNIAFQWFAPAGARRGLIDNATSIGYVDYTSGTFVKTGVSQSLRDTLYNLRINPISLLPGTGLTVYGNKTRSAIAQSTDRVNVARLVNYVRSTLAKISNSFLFEPNDKGTRDQIKSAIEATMNDLVAKRGIYDYLVVCDASNNTPDRIARNELYVDIAIEPMKSVEFIYIPIRLKNPGTVAGLGS
jgi:hypothetical protein